MNKQKFKYICLTFLFALTLLAVSANSHADGTVKKIKISERKSVLESNKGKVVILDLWATWCPYCRKEIPGFINLYNYPVYLDGGDITQSYDLQACPLTIICGKDGKEANKHIGFVSEKEFDDEIGNLLKK